MSSHKDIFLYRHTEESEILEGGGKDIPVGLQIICLYIFSVIKDLSRIGIIQPQHKLDDSGFSGAVMTDEACDHAVLCGKWNILHHIAVTVPLGEVLDLYQDDSSSQNEVLMSD